MSTVSALPALENRSNREVHTFYVPEKVGGNIKSVGLVELTAEEELMASKRSKGDFTRLAYEMAKISLAEMNGKPLSQLDGSIDNAWSSMSSGVRRLVMTGFNKIHELPEGAEDDFLKSQQTRV